MESKDHPFNGIFEKLNRADENIVNLNAELTAFIQNGKYPVVPHPDDKTWQEVVDYHRSKIIPKRYSVLAGEVIHHLRSILDHIVWQFSTDDARNKAPNSIEFPIFESEPVRKNEIQRYERKIQGITNSNVRRLIDELQPYNAGTYVGDYPLLIVHNMDRFDKHRELAIVYSTAFISVPPSMSSELIPKFEMYKQGKLPAVELIGVSRALKDHGQVTPQVSFREFGKGKPQPVIPDWRGFLKRSAQSSMFLLERFEDVCRGEFRICAAVSQIY
jgi:hypothetical protein